MSRRLWLDDCIHLTPKAFDLPSYLVERRDRLVSQNEIFETIRRRRAMSRRWLGSWKSRRSTS